MRRLSGIKTVANSIVNIHSSHSVFANIIISGFGHRAKGLLRSKYWNRKIERQQKNSEVCWSRRICVISDSSAYSVFSRLWSVLHSVSGFMPLWCIDRIFNHQISQPAELKTLVSLVEKNFHDFWFIRLQCISRLCWVLHSVSGFVFLWCIKLLREFSVTK